MGCLIAARIVKDTMFSFQNMCVHKRNPLAFPNVVVDIDLLFRRLLRDPFGIDADSEREKLLMLAEFAVYGTINTPRKKRNQVVESFVRLLPELDNHPLTNMSYAVALPLFSVTQRYARDLIISDVRRALFFITRISGSLFAADRAPGFPAMRFEKGAVLYRLGDVGAQDTENK